MRSRKIEEVTLVRDVSREVTVSQVVTVQVTDSGGDAGLTLEDILAHLDEHGVGDDICRGGKLVASVGVDEETVDEADNDATAWETESVVYADQPDTISGIGLDAAELYRLACKRYELACERQGEFPQQPCRYRSVVSDDEVVLANVKGELARYQIVNGQPAETK